MRKLTETQHKINNEAIKWARTHDQAERHLIEALIQVEKQKIHKLLGHRSMFLYTTIELKLSEAVALSLIAVARRANTLPQLREAIAKGKITPAKASRVAAHINEQNAEEIISFASSHTTRETD